MPEIVLADERIYPGAWIHWEIKVIDPETEAKVFPVALSVTTRDPDDTRTTYVYGVDPELVSTGVGEFYIDFEVDKASRWFVEVESDEPYDIYQYAVSVRYGKFD